MHLTGSRISIAGKTCGVMMSLGVLLGGCGQSLGSRKAGSGGCGVSAGLSKCWEEHNQRCMHCCKHQTALTRHRECMHRGKAGRLRRTCSAVSDTAVGRIPGKRRQQVTPDMTAEMRWLRSPKEGVVSFRVRKQMSYRASLSRICNRQYNPMSVCWYVAASSNQQQQDTCKDRACC